MDGILVSVWNVLEIEPTGEESAIKKAYAKKLKQHHPEDDPEGYQKLREAYDAALKQAKHIAAMPVTAVLDTEGEEDTEEADAYDDDGMWQDENWEEDADEIILPEIQQHPVRRFLEQVEELYENFPSRIEPESWQELLNADIVWDVEHSQSLKDGLIAILEDSHHLPRSVWLVLDQVFHFSSDKDGLLDRYPNYFVEYMLRQISGSMELHYDCFRSSALPDDLDIESYLSLREEAQERFIDGDLEDAIDLLDTAHEMFADDPDLELMRSKYFLAVEEKDQALSCLQRVIELSPEDWDGHWHRAQLLHDLQRYEEALADLEVLLQQEPQNKHVLSFAGCCHLGLGQAAETRQKMKLANEQDNMHIQTIVYWYAALNKYMYKQDPVKPADRRKIRLHNLSFWTIVFIRLSWLPILLYLLLTVFLDLPAIVTSAFLLILLWNLWKTIRTALITST